MPVARASADARALLEDCRALIRRGQSQAKASDRLADYASAKDKCALAASGDPSNAEAHYWHGVAMGRWGQAKGMMKSLFLLGPIRREMAATLALDPKHGGAHRLLGEIHWQLPRLVGGDKKKGLAEFELAAQAWPNDASIRLVLARAYGFFKRKDDALAQLKAIEAIASPTEPANFADTVAEARKYKDELLSSR